MTRDKITFIVTATCIVLGLTLAFTITSTLATAYNTIVQSKVSVEQAVSDLDAAYQRRYALVENFVTITKETKAFEKFQIQVEREIYSEVAKAKADATKLNVTMPSDTTKRIEKEASLSASLMQGIEKLLVLAQHYPTITDPVLKDRNATFSSLRDLKQSIEGIESEIKAQRHSLNEAVKNYNQNVQIFPANVMAHAWGFEPMVGFTAISSEAKNDAKIKF